jgi:outer membrane protein OmpA-like peptidoglycan-associated protein
LKTKIKYYKGYLDCQFSTSTPEKIGNTFSQKSTIYLEPRFRLYDPIEIAESEFISEKELETKPYLVNKGKFDVEFYFNKSYASSYQISKPSDKKSIDTNELITTSTIEKVDEIILILNSNSVSSSNTKEQYINNYVYHEEGKNSFYANFYANYGKQTHGKINGEAYLKAIEYFDDNNKPIPTVQVIAIEKQERRIPAVLANNKGCLGMFSKSQPVVNTSIGPDGKAINVADVTGANNKGCLGSMMNPLRSVMNPSLAGGAGNPGCMPSAGAGGGGCLKSLLGLILGALLTYLLMNAWLAKNAPAPQIIHDTLEVEVVKEKLDTLMILKTDTLSFVDSTTKKTYETVNLPNVQFYTNSDVLLPSSAKELQQLAEYLVKNDSLNATVFGHTDNIGDQQANLKLSQRRAESVRNFLSSLGISSERLTAKGMGDKQPKADNSKDEGRLMNRRVEVVLTNKQIITTKRTQLPKDSSNPTPKN